MKTTKIFSIALFSFSISIFAQEIEAAKKAIDAEQFEKAKTILKQKPENGKAQFLLGTIYLTQQFQDSAKAAFQKGLTTKEFQNFNYIGLGQIDLDNGNTAAAQFNFDQALNGAKKKDIEQLVYIGKAYTQTENPNYTKAIEYLEKAKLINPTDTQLQMALGDAYFFNKNQNEAYKAYSNAIDTDATFIRAKMQLGVLLKGAGAYDEAKKALDGVIASNPNFGPAYRELAETYLQWGLTKEKSKFNEYAAKSLPLYEKFMSLTDYSLASRMRHADFLIIAKDYKALEKEALEMKKLDNVNPRILRYLGYASFENGNPTAAIEALNEYISKPSNKIIGRDYLYLGLAQIKIAIPEFIAPAKPTINQELFKTAVSNIQKAVDKDKPMANELNDIGKKYFDLKLYKEAAAIYEVATTNPNSKNFLYDNFFLGYAIYFDNSDKDEKLMDINALKKADVAFGNVAKASPTTQEAHIYRARVNALLPETLETQLQMATSYEDYIKTINGKSVEEATKAKNKLIESYQVLAKFYSKKDKVKAVDYINKTLTLDPTDDYSINLQKALK